jgi:hypothetical protein
MSVCLLLILIGRPRKVDMDLSWLYDEQKSRLRVSRSHIGTLALVDSLWMPSAYICVDSSPTRLQEGGPTMC